MRAIIRSFVFLVLALVLVHVFKPPQVKASQAIKGFMTACTYGVLTGALVGAATLAFEEQPGTHLNKVARGASLGLYAGILLGIYVNYGVPEESEFDEEGFMREEAQSKFRIYPLVGKNGIEGLGTQWDVFQF